MPEGALGEALEHAPNPSHFEDFRALERLLRSAAGVEDAIGSGASFGPFEGTFRGRPLDFVWHEPWTLFAVQRTVELLMEAGVSLPNAAPARPRDKAGAPVEFLEFQALPLVPLSERGLARMPSECRSCGRRGVVFDRFRVDSKDDVPGAYGPVSSSKQSGGLPCQRAPFQGGDRAQAFRMRLRGVGEVPD